RRSPKRKQPNRLSYRTHHGHRFSLPLLEQQTDHNSTHFLPEERHPYALLVQEQVHHVRLSSARLNWSGSCHIRRARSLFHSHRRKLLAFWQQLLHCSGDRSEEHTSELQSRFELVC